MEMLEWVAMLLMNILQEKSIDEKVKKLIKMYATYLGENRNTFNLVRLLRLLHEYELYHLLPTLDDIEAWFKTNQVF